MIQFSKIRLQDLLEIYDRELLPYEFIYHLRTGDTINLVFEQSQLGHLLAIQKVDKSRADFKGQHCYDKIKKGDLTFSKLKSINASSVVQNCKNKMMYFDELPEVLNNPECIEYNIGTTTRKTNIQMRFALYRLDKTTKCKLILGTDCESSDAIPRYFPRTWLIEKKVCHKGLLDGQERIDVMCVSKCER